MLEKLKKLLPICLILSVLACFVYCHRRVIRCWLNGEPMPEAPAWHIWCKKRAGV